MSSLRELEHSIVQLIINHGPIEKNKVRSILESHFKMDFDYIDFNLMFRYAIDKDRIKLSVTDKNKYVRVKNQV